MVDCAPWDWGMKVSSNGPGHMTKMAAMPIHDKNLNLLHAEVSYIIDIACHWTFFPILPVLATFWNAKTTIFFPFSNSQFLLNRTVELMFTNVALDYLAKTRY